jgi:hypothetical protein
MAYSKPRKITGSCDGVDNQTAQWYSKSEGGDIEAYLVAERLGPVAIFTKLAFGKRMREPLLSTAGRPRIFRSPYTFLPTITL